MATVIFVDRLSCARKDTGEISAGDAGMVQILNRGFQQRHHFMGAFNTKRINGQPSLLFGKRLRILQILIGLQEKIDRLARSLSQQLIFQDGVLFPDRNEFLRDLSWRHPP